MGHHVAKWKIQLFCGVSSFGVTQAGVPSLTAGTAGSTRPSPVDRGCWKKTMCWSIVPHRWCSTYRSSNTNADQNSLFSFTMNFRYFSHTMNTLRTLWHRRGSMKTEQEPWGCLFLYSPIPWPIGQFCCSVHSFATSAQRNTQLVFYIAFTQ